MFEKIVLGVDGSDYSAKAIPLAAEIASKFGSEVIVVHVFEHMLGRAAVAELETPEEVHELVDSAVRTLKDEGVSARAVIVHTRFGHAAREMLDLAKTEPASMIIVGSRGLGELSGMLLGSVTHKLLHLAEIPILVAR